MTRTRAIAWAAAGLVVVAAGGLALTRSALLPPPDKLRPPADAGVRAQVLDRTGRPLSITYDSDWNVHDEIPLHDVPQMLRAAFLAAEDRRFFEHGGVDWRARFGAFAQNVRARRGVRGASTITEQVVKMLNPRPRTPWTRWVEGFEATRLEDRFTKGEILEFYLNQVPYARRRRGIVQAARDYFDRDLDTLRPKEMLALAVLVRSPSRLDLRRSIDAVEAPVRRLARALARDGVLDERQARKLESEPLELRAPRLRVEAPHFVGYVRGRAAAAVRRDPRLRTTLDGSLQRRVEAILEHQIAALSARGVSDGAVLAVDHRDDSVLAWVNAGGFSEKTAGSRIDAILSPRQPGSTLKPFLYACALERGWTAATLIDDSPLAQPVGSGLHRYRNYSRGYYGPLRLREALGNSLNVPAVRTIQAVTPTVFYRKLHELGFDSLELHPETYGEGLALGNGEVTLRELVGAYAVLARGGIQRRLRALAPEAVAASTPRRVFDAEVSSIVADILSDAEARALEFGTGGVLELPVPTAVKTGTSNDYRDAWAMGFSDRHTVGVWMGNLDRQEMDGVTGAVGPALVLRAVFAELQREAQPEPVYLSRKLSRVEICRASGRMPGASCPVTREWFRPRHVPVRACPIDHDGGSDAVVSPGPASGAEREVRWIQPTPGLHLAMDPRIPDDLEAFALRIEPGRPATRVEWFVDGSAVGTSLDGEHRLAWPVRRGEHVARARVWFGPAETVETPEVLFLVK